MQTKVFAVLALLLLSGIAYQTLKAPPQMEMQKQEEVAEALINVFYQASSRHEERIIDLLWLQEAAEETLDAGATYFNIFEQNIGTARVNGREFTYMEGIIEITDDVSAEFNAEQIARVDVEEL